MCNSTIAIVSGKRMVQNTVVVVPPVRTSRRADIIPLDDEDGKD